MTFPHLHLVQGAAVGRQELQTAHLPTGRVSIEQFLQVCFGDFKAEPLRDNYEAILAESELATDR